MGSVVWGRTGEGAVWWPGRVEGIYTDEVEEEMVAVAAVAWYGLEVTSVFACSELKAFKDSFQVRLRSSTACSVLSVTNTRFTDSMFRYDLLNLGTKTLLFAI